MKFKLDTRRYTSGSCRYEPSRRGDNLTLDKMVMKVRAQMESDLLTLARDLLGKDEDTLSDGVAGLFRDLVAGKTLGWPKDLSVEDGKSASLAILLHLGLFVLELSEDGGAGAPPASREDLEVARKFQEMLSRQGAPSLARLGLLLDVLAEDLLKAAEV